MAKGVYIEWKENIHTTFISHKNIPFSVFFSSLSVYFFSWAQHIEHTRYPSLHYNFFFLLGIPLVNIIIVILILQFDIRLMCQYQYIIRIFISYVYSFWKSSNNSNKKINLDHIGEYSVRILHYIKYTCIYIVEIGKTMGDWLIQNHLKSDRLLGCL